MTSPTNCLVRELRLADVPAIAKLAREFAQYMRGLGDLTELSLDAEALERDGFGAEPAFDGLVAEVAGEVVGYLLYHGGYDTDVACRLLVVADLFVTESARGRGVGVALIQRARAVAASRGAKQMAWSVYRPNALARRFYERIGGRYVKDLDQMCLDIDRP
jgi:GNAT superfamily N-acetyltransferase